MKKSVFAKVTEINSKIATMENAIMDAQSKFEFLEQKENKKFVEYDIMEQLERDMYRWNRKLEEYKAQKSAIEQEVESVVVAPVVKMDLQLMAQDTEGKELSKKDIAKSIVTATDAGFEVKNACQAHIVNNLAQLFNDKFYMKENNKTDRIPVFNLPNIKIQVDFLQLVKNNPQIMDLVPADEREQFQEFVNYLKSQAMCVNCQGCKKECYNNKAYTQYPTKAICDLRQLYRTIQKPHTVVGNIVQETINAKNARLNGSGEIHNEQILQMYIAVAKANPTTSYYTYTKNYAIIAGRKLPKNLVINLSDFGTTEILAKYREELPANLNTFKAVTKEEVEEIKKDKKLAKYICRGESCSTCGLCTKKKGITIFCPIH